MKGRRGERAIIENCRGAGAAVENRPRQTRPGEIGAVQANPSKARIGKACAAKSRAGQVEVGEGPLDKLTAAEIGAPQRNLRPILLPRPQRISEQQFVDREASAPSATIASSSRSSDRVRCRASARENRASPGSEPASPNARGRYRAPPTADSLQGKTPAATHGRIETRLGRGPRHPAAQGRSRCASPRPTARPPAWRSGRRAPGVRSATRAASLRDREPASPTSALAKDEQPNVPPNPACLPGGYGACRRRARAIGRPSFGRD